MVHLHFSLLTQIGYHISFTLLVPDPQFYAAGWNIEEAVTGLFHLDQAAVPRMNAFLLCT